jgi:hypothetical protein
VNLADEVMAGAAASLSTAPFASGLRMTTTSSMSDKANVRKGGACAAYQDLSWLLQAPIGRFISWLQVVVHFGSTEGLFHGALLKDLVLSDTDPLVIQYDLYKASGSSTPQPSILINMEVCSPSAATCGNLVWEYYRGSLT